MMVNSFCNFGKYYKYIYIYWYLEDDLWNIQYTRIYNIFDIIWCADNWIDGCTFQHRINSCNPCSTSILTCSDSFLQYVSREPPKNSLQIKLCYCHVYTCVFDPKNIGSTKYWSTLFPLYTQCLIFCFFALEQACRHCDDSDCELLAAKKGWSSQPNTGKSTLCPGEANINELYLDSLPNLNSPGVNWGRFLG